jgi:hypothetical protein
MRDSGLAYAFLEWFVDVKHSTLLFHSQFKDGYWCCYHDDLAVDANFFFFFFFFFFSYFLLVLEVEARKQIRMDTWDPKCAINKAAVTTTSIAVDNRIIHIRHNYNQDIVSKRQVFIEEKNI